MVAIPEEVGPRPLIPEFYAGRSVLITGATGFMGKVLVERLLATCPDIGRLYLLVRSKRDLSPEKRLLELKNGQAFAVIRQSCPRQLEKLHLVAGDISRPGLGLSIHSIAQLDEVSLIFNCAATVRFDEPLKVAVKQNVLSVTRLCELADRLPHVAAFIHVSTAYCNADHPKIEEKVYPLPKPLHTMIEEGLAIPDDTPVDELKRMVHPKPNTYTFTKMMAETAAKQHGRRYPLAIFRPSIVISALRHPFPGWVENYNGPIGVMVAISNGLLHVLRVKGSARADMLPVDLAIDTLIAVGWETAIDNLPTVRVYNCCTGENPTTWEEMRSNLVEETRRQPLMNVSWYPTCLFTNCGFLHYTLTFLLQTAPLHLAEYLFRLFSHKKNRLGLIRAESRLRTMNRTLQFFATKQWDFVTDNVRLLRERLSHQDALIYNLDPFTIHWKSHYQNCVRGCRLYLIGDKEENLPEAKNRLSRMYVIHRSLTILLPILVLWRSAAPTQKLVTALFSVLKQSFITAICFMNELPTKLNA